MKPTADEHWDGATSARPAEHLSPELTATAIAMRNGATIGEVLAAKDAYIRRLEVDRAQLIEALLLCERNCINLHHEKHEYHNANKPCLVEAKINALLTRLKDGS